MALVTSAGAMKAGNLLAEKLRSARLAEGAHHAAIVDIRDASLLRLQLLKDGIEPEIAAAREAPGFIDLALVADFPPRLWIDMVSYVVMAPDPRTYRFQRDTRAGHEVIREASSLDQMVDAIAIYVAHRMIERERNMEQPRAEVPRAPTSKAPLILAWLSGLTTGVFAMLIALILLNMA